MVTVSFPEWSDALSAADLPAKARQRHRVIILWFLGYLSRERERASVSAARAFVEDLDRGKLYVRAAKGDKDRCVPLPRSLRESLVAHLLENGTNIRTVQEFLGHTCVETTMIYLHVMEDQKDLTLSPLDSL